MEGKITTARPNKSHNQFLAAPLCAVIVDRQFIARYKVTRGHLAGRAMQLSLGLLVCVVVVCGLAADTSNAGGEVATIHPKEAHTHLRVRRYRKERPDSGHSSSSSRNVYFDCSTETDDDKTEQYFNFRINHLRRQLHKIKRLA